MRDRDSDRDGDGDGDRVSDRVRDGNMAHGVLTPNSHPALLKPQNAQIDDRDRLELRFVLKVPQLLLRAEH